MSTRPNSADHDPTTNQNGGNCRAMKSGQATRRLSSSIRASDTIICESETIEDHIYCDWAIRTSADENRELRAELLQSRKEFLELEACYKDLKAQHILCPFYIQKPEEEIKLLMERCETLSSEKKRYEGLCEEYAAILRRHEKADIPHSG